MIGMLLNRLFCRPGPPAPSDIAYAAAMSESGDLLQRMQEAAKAPDAVRSLMASIWLQRHNVPFVATVHEAVQEMKAPMAGDTAARPPPPRNPGK